jgi:hypothetical protein
MDSTGRIVLRLEVITCRGEPISGLVWGRDGVGHEFSGWSEMFAILQRLTSPPGDGHQTEGDVTS